MKDLIRKLFKSEDYLIYRCWFEGEDVVIQVEMLRPLSFTTSCEMTGTSYTSLRRELLWVIRSGEIDWQRLCKVVDQLIIGIDEHSIRGQRMATTITDIGNQNFHAVLKDHRKESIRELLRAIPPQIKEKVREVCGDMKWMYAKLA